MSAITDEPEGHVEPLKVLITMHDGMDSMDVIGPLEVFSWAQHDSHNAGKYQVLFVRKLHPYHINSTSSSVSDSLFPNRDQSIPHHLRGCPGARGHRSGCVFPRSHHLR